MENKKIKKIMHNPVSSQELHIAGQKIQKSPGKKNSRNNQINQFHEKKFLIFAMKIK